MLDQHADTLAAGCLLLGTWLLVVTAVVCVDALGFGVTLLAHLSGLVGVRPR